jgi:WAS family protein 2
MIDKLPEVEEAMMNQEMKPFTRERSSWQSDRTVPCNFFTKATQPSYITSAYEACPPIPALQILDEFRTDGKSCIKLFSYPEFFVEEWKLLLQKEHDGKKARKRTKDIDLSIPEERDISTPSVQSPFISTPQKAGRERVRIEVPAAPVLPTVATQQAPVAPKVAAPPPPPPPPPPVGIAPPPPPPQSTPVSTTTPNGSHAPPKRGPSGAGNDAVGFLDDIRSKQVYFLDIVRSQKD